MRTPEEQTAAAKAAGFQRDDGTISAAGWDWIGAALESLLESNGGTLTVMQRAGLSNTLGVVAEATLWNERAEANPEHSGVTA